MRKVYVACNALLSAAVVLQFYFAELSNPSARVTPAWSPPTTGTPGAPPRAPAPPGTLARQASRGARSATDRRGSPIKGESVMTPDRDGVEPFNPAANPADSAEAFEDDDRDDDSVENGAPALNLSGGGLDG